jgi:predicted Rossmann-fold nucleotide-binding protein
MDELFELLTLIQCRKIDPVPVMLYDSGYWRGLLNWLSETMLPAGAICASDIELVQLVDDPETVVCRVASMCDRARAHQPRPRPHATAPARF